MANSKDQPSVSEDGKYLLWNGMVVSTEDLYRSLMDEARFGICFWLATESVIQLHPDTEPRHLFKRVDPLTTGVEVDDGNSMRETMMRYRELMEDPAINAALDSIIGGRRGGRSQARELGEAIKSAEAETNAVRDRLGHIDARMAFLETALRQIGNLKPRDQRDGPTWPSDNHSALVKAVSIAAAALVGEQAAPHDRPAFDRAKTRLAEASGIISKAVKDCAFDEAALALPILDQVGAALDSLAGDQAAEPDYEQATRDAFGLVASPSYEAGLLNDPNRSGWMDPLLDEIIRQDEVYGGFHGSRVAMSRLAIGCLEDELDEARLAWREDGREYGIYETLGEELLQIAAIALRAVRDCCKGDAHAA